MLHHAEQSGKLKGIKVCNGAPSINHLLFADNSLLLMEANARNAQEVNRILNIYEACSGQVVNKEKSTILYSKNTRPWKKEEVRRCLHITTEGLSPKYLGVPTYIGKSKTKTFEYIKERVCKKIQGWKEKLLSKASKEILIKVVVQAIPVYTMACFDIPKSICDDLSSMIGCYWWNQID